MDAILLAHLLKLIVFNMDKYITCLKTAYVKIRRHYLKKSFNPIKFLNKISLTKINHETHSLIDKVQRVCLFQERVMQDFFIENMALLE